MEFEEYFGHRLGPKALGAEGYFPIVSAFFSTVLLVVVSNFQEKFTVQWTFLHFHI